MRVLQLIDSLRSGGAEQMAVSYANALAGRVDGSYLCCTRIEGYLKKKLSSEVNFIFLKKKGTLDPRAFWKLRSFVKKNKIDIIQAHSSSWFLALLVKLSLANVKLVWHDHHGIELNNNRPRILKMASQFFDGIISVNTGLKKWAEENLNSGQVRYFRNFLPAAEYVYSAGKDQIKLKGKEGFCIICIANLRPQKDHLTLLKAFKKVQNEHPKVSLHLIGKDEQDDYSRKIKKFVKQNQLQEKVFFYGEKENISAFLEQADMGVLSSASEGLPVALLEYGWAGLPVVSTDVGQCANVLSAYGKLVPPKDSNALAEAIAYYIANEKQRIEEADLYRQRILQEFSEEEVLPEVLNFLLAIKNS